MIRRILRIGLAWMPAVVLLGMAALWADSFRCARVAGRIDPKGTAHVAASEGGRVILTRLAFPAGPGEAETNLLRMGREELRQLWDSLVASADVKTQRIQFAYLRQKDKIFGYPGWGMVAVAVPYWALAAPLVIFPLRRLRRAMRRRYRRKHNLCLNCGYDLRATPERCPECGQQPAGRGAGVLA